MGGETGPDDACPRGSGRKQRDCCRAPEATAASVRPKDLKHLEWTPGLAGALARSLDASYLEYWSAAR